MQVEAPTIAIERMSAIKKGQCHQPKMRFDQEKLRMKPTPHVG